MIAIDMPMPLSCEKCGLRTDSGRCMVEKKRAPDDGQRPDWCPLRQAMTLKAAMIPPDYPDPEISRKVVRNEVARSIMRRLEDDGVILFEEGTDPFGLDMIIGKLDVVFPEGMTVEQARRLVWGVDDDGTD